MAHDVFISYSSSDKSTADAVCTTLESHGVACWIAPRDVLPGEEYAAALVRAVHESRLMVLVFSSRANRSPQVLREVERAVSKGITIVPFRIENVPPTAAMEYYISSCHWLDALGAPLNRHLETLASTATQLLSRTGGRAAAAGPAESVKAAAAPNVPVATKRSMWPRVAVAGGMVVIVAALIAYFIAGRTTTPAAAAAARGTRAASQPESAAPAPATPSPASTSSTPAPNPPPVADSTPATPPAKVEPRQAPPNARRSAPTPRATDGAAASPNAARSPEGATKSPECARLLERVSLGEGDLLTAAERATLAQCGR